MHIPHEEKPTGEAASKTGGQTKKKQGIWRFIRFVVVTGLIFSITFFTVNFGAYKNKFSRWIDPEHYQQAQELLKESTQISIDPEQLLPTLPDKPEIQKEYEWLDFPIISTQNRLILPTLAKNVPLVETGKEHLEGGNWTALEKQIQEALKNGVVHYPATAKPGEYGNVFITGHSSYYGWDNGKFKTVFESLSKLSVGDVYYIDYEGKRYVYQVYDKYEVYPDNVDIMLQPEDKKISTLMTCTPIGTTLRRLVINAKDITSEGKKMPSLPMLG